MSDNFFQNALRLQLGQGLFSTAESDGGGFPPPPGDTLFRILPDGTRRIYFNSSNEDTQRIVDVSS